MQKYSEFQPTGFDPKGLNAEYYGIGDFLVVPVSHNRDSECLAESNFAVALKMLGGESDTVQVHRFGHWGPGWFELILVDPRDEEKVKIAEQIESSLADYPILDEEDHSRRENEECERIWTRCYDEQDRLDYFRKNSYTATSYSDLLKAIRRADWYWASNMLHDPSSILY